MTMERNVTKYVFSEKKEVSYSSMELLLLVYGK